MERRKKEHTLHLLQRQDDAAGPCKNTWNSQTQGVTLAVKKKKRSTFTATWRKHLNQHFELTAINYNQLQETTYKRSSLSPVKIYVHYIVRQC